MRWGHLAEAVSAVALVFGIITLICVILRTRTCRVRAASCTQVFSLVSTQLLMKQLSSERFNFPALVTALHFFTVWVVCGLYWAYRRDLAKCSPQSLGSTRRYFTHISPIACSLPLSVALNNQALMSVGAGLTGIVSMLAPITTALLSHALGRAIHPSGWIGIFVVCIGATVIGYGEFESPQASASVMWGLFLAASSVALRSVKVVLQDQLMTPAAYGHKLGGQPTEPMHIWALQAPPCFASALLYALAVERPSDALLALKPQVAWLVLASCVSASVLNILGMCVIKELGASMMQIMGKLNTVIVLAVAVVFLGETLPPVVLVGVCYVLAGVALFERRSAVKPKQKDLVEYKV